MSNNKQSSIEWLVSQLNKKGFAPVVTDDEIEQAKAMHKKETIDFALHCMMPKMNPDKATIEVVSDIYDEFFGGDK